MAKITLKSGLDGEMVFEGTAEELRELIAELHAEISGDEVEEGAEESKTHTYEVGDYAKIVGGFYGRDGAYHSFKEGEIVKRVSGEGSAGSPRFKNAEGCTQYVKPSMVEPADAPAEDETLKVGDYAKVVQEGHGRYGEIVRVVSTDYSGYHPYDTETLDGEEADCHTAAQLEKVAAPAEPTPEPSPQVPEGHVKIPNDLAKAGDLIVFADDDDLSDITGGKAYEITRLDNDGDLRFLDDDDYENYTDRDYGRFETFRKPIEGTPQVGDKILVVDAYDTGGKYRNGDVLTVTGSTALIAYVEEHNDPIGHSEFVIIDREAQGSEVSTEESIEKGDIVVNEDGYFDEVVGVKESGYLDADEGITLKNHGREYAKDWKVVCKAADRKDR